MISSVTHMVTKRRNRKAIIGEPLCARLCSSTSDPPDRCRSSPSAPRSRAPFAGRPCNPLRDDDRLQRARDRADGPLVLGVVAQHLAPGIPSAPSRFARCSSRGRRAASRLLGLGHIDRFAVLAFGLDVLPPFRPGIIVLAHGRELGRRHDGGGNGIVEALAPPPWWSARQRRGCACTVRSCGFTKSLHADLAPELARSASAHRRRGCSRRRSRR